MPAVKVFFIVPAIYWTMTTLAIENTMFTLTSSVGIDEYTQSVHGPSPALKLLNASCADAVIRMSSQASFTIMDWLACDRTRCVERIKPRLTSSTAMAVFLRLLGYGSMRGFEPRRSCFALSPATTTSLNRELSAGPVCGALSLILFTPEQTSKDSRANKNPLAHDYSSAVLVLGASGSFGIVRFEKQTDGTRRAGRRSRCREWF